MNYESAYSDFEALAPSAHAGGEFDLCKNDYAVHGLLEL